MLNLVEVVFISWTEEVTSLLTNIVNGSARETDADCTWISVAAIDEVTTEDDVDWIEASRLATSVVWTIDEATTPG
tara:strand:+ start:1525 stop:1752 length:228 start_codon:yes stop_codon:yes gene_type:complete